MNDRPDLVGPGPLPTPGECRPYFFLSYARSDDDLYVSRFFNDLCAEVRVRAGLASTVEVGFFDTRSIDLGEDWSTELVHALCRCTTFVALCSPRYFLSEPCGREWQLFADRLHRHGQATGQTPAAQIPVLWLPPRVIPAAVRRLQYDNARLGEAYRIGGFRQLLRLQRNHDEYIEALGALADRIVDNATSQPLPLLPDRDAPRFEEVRNAFIEPAAGARHPSAGSVIAATCPTAYTEHVRFVVAAPDRREASAVRYNTEFYGEDPTEWTPYRPAMCQPLARFACAVAARRGLTSEVSTVPRPVAGGMRGPGAHGSQPGLSVPQQGTGGQPPSAPGIVILLVDPWAVQLEEYRAAIADHELRSPATAAMVPRNQDDHETSDNWRRLHDGLQGVFVRRAASGEAIAYRPDILSHRAFDEDLQVVLEVARNKIFAQPAASGDSPGARTAAGSTALPGPQAVPGQRATPEVPQTPERQPSPAQSPTRGQSPTPGQAPRPARTRPILNGPGEMR